MKTQRTFFIIISFFFIVSCKTKNNSDNQFSIINDAENENTELKIDETDIEETDIEKIAPIETEKTYPNEKCIIFFMPTDDEIDEIIDHYGEYDKYDFVQLFSNFKTIAKSTKSDVSKDEIFSEIVTYSKIQIETDSGLFTLKRKETNDLVGQIFYNGEDKPSVIYGVMKNKKMNEYIEEFFEKE